MPLVAPGCTRAGWAGAPGGCTGSTAHLAGGCIGFAAIASSTLRLVLAVCSNREQLRYPGAATRRANHVAFGIHGMGPRFLARIPWYSSHQADPTSALLMRSTERLWIEEEPHGQNTSRLGFRPPSPPSACRVAAPGPRSCSRLPQSACASHRIDAVALAYLNQSPARCAVDPVRTPGALANPGCVAPA